MHRVEHDHTLTDVRRVRDELAAARIAAPDLERRAARRLGLRTRRSLLLHTAGFREIGLQNFARHHFISSMIATSSGGSAGMGRRESSIRPSSPLRTIMLKRPYSGSFSG